MTARDIIQKLIAFQKEKIQDLRDTAEKLKVNLRLHQGAIREAEQMLEKLKNELSYCEDEKPIVRITAEPSVAAPGLQERDPKATS